MSIHFLHKNRSSSISSDTSKYYIKCDAIDTANRIEIVKLLQKQRDEDSRVLLAYLEKNHSKMNIVVKMARENGTIRKEYSISEHLHKTNCSGFMKFICIFDCYDNNSSDKICQGTPEKNSKKEVLIMNYFNEGSVKSHGWTNSNFHILRSILIQTIYSLIVAYHNTGFIHNDSHLDNILIKRTTRTHNNYQIDERTIQIETNNYTCMITDFENCFFTDKSSPIFFWKMIENIITRVGIELTNNKGDKIEASKIYYEILGYISNNKNNNYLHVLSIIPMIERMEFTVLRLPKTMVYDSNVY
jgi:serine/threonine protein kinase